ncbi:MAG: hypothetical protein NC401_18075 [Ruminococcus sp.]|nr:hypothetical protein [Ruminococcus sp.]
MILQNILFPSISTCTLTEMYFRNAVSGRAEFNFTEPRVKFRKGDRLHFDTYFNSITVEKWKKYTYAENFTLTLTLRGNVRVILIRKELVNGAAETEYLAEHMCCAEEPREFTFGFSSSSSNGIYCFSLIGERGVSEFFGGYYSAEIPEEKVRGIKLAVDICTYRRETFVEKNLALLNERFLENPDSPLYDGLEVFISDNAGTLDIGGLSSDKIHIFRNKNTGGAGGFTRGLIEISDVKDERGITHALLMDDDVLIEPEAIFRTFVMLSCVKERYFGAFIGGAMLRLDRQNIQVESGAVWAGGNIVSLKRGLDLINCGECMFNETEENPQFNAWWYCAFPIDVVNGENLPMPIFIRGDDVEYGLRNMKQLILLNGICVWHEPFEKKYSSFLFYYILRNRLIDNALHNMVIPREAFIELLREQVMEQVRLYRYKNANLLMRGVEDFLRGVNWLAEQDGEALHKEIMSEGYKLLPIEELEEPAPFVHAMYADSVQAQNPVTFKYRTLRKYTVNGIFFLPTNGTRPYNIVPVEGAKDINVYRTETVLNYEQCGRRGFITHKDPNAAKRTIERLKKLSKKLTAEYDNAVKNYAENGRELMRRDFWNGYLGLKE